MIPRYWKYGDVKRDGEIGRPARSGDPGGLLEEDLDPGAVHLLDEGGVGRDLDPGQVELVGPDLEVVHRRSADVDLRAELVELAQLLVRRVVPCLVQAAAR